MESVNSIPFAGKTITYSFYARGGANYSATSNGLTVNFSTSTGTDQTAWGTLTGVVAQVNSNVTLTTSWQRFVFTFTVPTNSTQLTFFFLQSPTGTAGANDWYEVTGVQIDNGTYTASTAPTFRRSGGTIQGELAACMRYCEKIELASGVPLVTGQAYSTTNAWAGISWTTQKRTTPTITQTGTIQALQSNTGTSGTTFAYTTLSTNYARMEHSGGSGLVAGNASLFQAIDGAVSLLITAEL
jgi:hypothetical protein